MSLSSAVLSSNGTESTYRRPPHRKDFQVAIICSLALEYDAATLLVDEFWDDHTQYGRTSGDTNTYRNGRIGMHNVVLILLPNMGKAAIAGSAASLRTSYSNLRIAFLVGVCGGVPMLGSYEALLGDVVVGEAIIQYDFGRQYPEKFIPKETVEATQSIPNKEIRTFLAYFKSETGKQNLRQNTVRHLKALQTAAQVKHYQESYRYPGFDEDKLFEATYQHKHRRIQSSCDSCNSKTETYCNEAAQSSCDKLECDKQKLVPRRRLESKQHLEWEEAQCPDIFIGRVASADTVMKSGEHRDQIARQYNIIAFEMEGAGLWDEVPCIVVKGFCDYADSHKNKIWQPFAAATAAAAVKAMLERYTIADDVQLCASSSVEIERVVGHVNTMAVSGQNGHNHPEKLQIFRFGTRTTSSVSTLSISQPNGAQILRDAIFDFQRALNDDQRRELQRIKAIPDADAVLVFTAELDSLNRNRKGRSIASRLYSVLQSVRDFSATVEAHDSTHMGVAPLLWGSVKLAMFVAVKFVTYYEALSKFFMDLGGFCPLMRDYQIFYSSSPPLRNALHSFYASLIRCCKRAVETTGRSWPVHFFNIWQESFERDFQLDADDIKRRSKYVKDALSISKRQADHQNQQLQTGQRNYDSKKERFMNIFNQKDNQHENIKAWRVQSDERQKNERKQNLLDSLSTHDYLTPFKQSRRKRYRGTLEWLFQTYEYDRWINGLSCLLWCSGKIGSGKTILTSSVIDKLLIEKRSSDVFISFFFIRFDDQQSLNAEVVLKSIARQILNSSTLSEEVKTLLDQMRLDLASGLGEISKLLQRIAKPFATLYIIIDGLDECAKQDRHDLLKVLSSVVKATSNTKIFLSGRDSVSREVQRKFPTLEQLRMDCPSAQADITSYVESIIEEKLENEELIVGDPNLIEDIKMALSEGANGMILWVAFQVDELCLQHCDDDIRKVIRNLPKDLEQTFDRAVDRIVSRGDENIAKQAFRWVAAAREPLTLDQLREAIFIEIGQQYSKRDRRPNDIDRIGSWCENLVNVDEELKTVHFVHQTVQQFFFEKSSEARNNQFHINLEDADHYVGEICVTYLNFNDFKTSLSRRQQPLPPMPPIAIAGTALRPRWKAVASIPIIWKANTDIRGGSVAANAVEASASFQRDDTGDAEERLQARHPFIGYASIHWIFHTRMFQKEKSKMYNLWEKMVLEGHDIVKKPWGDGPFVESTSSILEWCLKIHHYALIRILLHADMISTHDKNSILIDASTTGNITLIETVLEREHPDLEVDRACFAAASRCHIDICKRLLAAGVDGQEVLQLAGEKGSQPVIEHLLAAGVNGEKALRIAVKKCSQPAIKGLLAAGIDGDAMMQTAAECYDLDSVKALLVAGLDGKKALQIASTHGSPRSIKCLLAAGLDGQAALRAAVEGGHLSRIDNLLAAGINVNTPIVLGGQRVLHVASKRGHVDATERLLAAGARVNARTIQGNETALYMASLGGHVDVVEKLLGAGAQVNVQTTQGNETALYVASCGGHVDVVEKLLGAGAQVNIRTIPGNLTALHVACRGGHVHVAEKLLAAGAQVNARTMQGNKTALYMASLGGHVDVVEKLLGAGAQVNVQATQENETALYVASHSGHIEVVEKLLEAGASV